MSKSATSLNIGDIIGCYKLIKKLPGGHKYEWECLKCGHCFIRHAATTKDWIKKLPNGCELCSGHCKKYLPNMIIGRYKLLQQMTEDIWLCECTKCHQTIQRTVKQLHNAKHLNSKTCPNCPKNVLSSNKGKYKSGDIIKNYKLISKDLDNPNNWIVECIKCGHRHSLCIRNILKTKRNVCYYCLHPDATINKLNTSRNKYGLLPIEERIYNYYKKRVLYDNEHGNKYKEWKLTISEFKSLITQPCYYCGCDPTFDNQWNNGTNKAKTRKPIAINGIDRKDSFEGYTKENCVPCCTKCNRMKGDMSTHEFLEKVKLINKKWCSTTIEKQENPEPSRVVSSETKQSDSEKNMK